MRQFRFVGSAPVACIACRRLKMRCTGANNPPCARCKKSGRECIVPVRHTARSSRHSATRTQASPALALDAVDEDLQQCDTVAGLHQTSFSQSIPSYTPPYVRSVSTVSPVHEYNDFRPNRLSVTDLPSIYSTPPIRAISPLAIARVQPSLNPLEKRQISTSNDCPMYSDRYNDLSSSVPDCELIHLAEFFKVKLAHVLPTLREADVAEIPVLLETKRPLVLCMAFVASRFAPGQRSIRVQLVPQILNTLRLRHGISRRSEDDKWMFLQALGILYAWASPLPLERISDDDAINAQLSHTDLKALVESTALTLSLHRSADDVAELVWNEKEIRDSLALRKYLFWLWLYTLAHRYSLLTSTPPTIPEDTTIKLAPDLLKNLIDDHYVGRIMSEIDLSLLWRQAGLHQHGLGEWWCLLSPNDINIPSALAVIGDLTKALDIWSERWCPAGGLNMDIRFMFITFNYRFSRFCISTYFVRILRSISAEKMPYSTQLNYVLESVRAAVTFCGYILELPPLTIDYGRYLADTAFVKIAYACEFVLRGCEILHTNPDYDDLRSSLNTVKDVALLMHQLAVDEVHCAKFYGQALLEKVHDFEKRLQSGPVAWERSPASTQDTSYQPAQDLHSPESRSGGLFSDLIKEFAAEAAFIDPFLLQ